MPKTAAKPNTENKQQATQQGRAVERRPQTFTGVVVSAKMKDTAVVVIERYVKHQKYGKYMNRRSKIMAHDPGNTKQVGEKVTIVAIRPMSKRKNFKIA